MSPRSILLVVTALVCAATLLVTQRYRAAVRLLEADRARSAERRAATRMETERERRRTAIAERHLAELRTALAEVRASTSNEVATDRVATTPPPAPVPFSPQEVLRKDPELQLLYLQSQRVSLAANYAPLLRQLGLSAAEAERFNDLVLRHAERIVDIQGAAQTQSLALDDPVIEQLRGEAEQELRNAQRALLGDERYQQVAEYERTLPARGAIDQLAGRLAFTAAPLRLEQADQLTEVFARASQRFRAGGKSDETVFDNEMLNYAANGSLTPDGWRHPHPGNFDWPGALNAAANILSPGQFATFEAMIKRDLTAMQLFNLAQDARLRGEPPPAAGTKPSRGG